MVCNIEIEDDEIRIKELSLRNEEIVDYYRDLEEKEACEDLQKAFLLGTVAMKSMKVTEKVDYIQKEFNKLDQSFRVTLEDTLRELDEYLGENGELPNKIEELFGEDGKIINELFDPNKDGTPLNELKKDILDEMVRWFKKKEREKVKPTKIGEDFENFVEEGLNDIISSRRDCCDVLRNTATETGLMDTTTGDFIIEVEGREKTKLVIEVKDYQSIDGSRIKSNMEEAMENRDASYGIFINKNVEALPDYMGWFHDYPKDKYLVCALTDENENALHEEILHMAYQWGRTKTMYEEAVAEGIEVSTIEEGMEEVKEGIEKISNLRRKYTLVENSVGEMREISNDIESFVERGLRNIQEEINRAMQED